MTSSLEGDTQCLSIPGVGEGILLGLLSWGKGEMGAGSKPSGSREGLSLSQMSCYQSPFLHSHYGASPALSDESVPGASRGLVVKVAPLLSKRVLHSLALKVQAIFAGHLIEVIILQKGLFHHPS